MSLGINAIFILLRFLVFRSSCTRATWLLYLGLSTPAFAIEVWFERAGRPTLGPNGELRRPGDDLEAKGLTEYMFDVLYWTWGSTAMAAIFGDKAWWMWIAVPLYSIWLAYSTFGGMRRGLTALTGQGAEGNAHTGAVSNRQKKLEKRGGQKVQYR
jgi:hypothetical protein